MTASPTHIAAVAALLPSVGKTPHRSLPNVPPSSLRAALRALVEGGSATFTGDMGKRLYSRREPSA